MTTTCLPPVVSHPEVRHRIRVLAGHDVLIGDVDVHEVITVVERLPFGLGSLRPLGKVCASALIELIAGRIVQKTGFAEDR